MKQNIYDHPDFFSAYKDFRNQDQGMNGLLEQPVMKRMMQFVYGKNILDLGCGLGHQIEELLKSQPREVVGVDISQKMLAEASARIDSPVVTWSCAAIEDYFFKNEYFDIVISSMTLHYIADLKSLFQHISDTLKPGGQFLFSIEHPACTAGMELFGGEGDSGGYAIEGARQQDWFVKGVVKYHRKLSTIIKYLQEVGLTLRALEEPTPDDILLQQRPDFAKHIQCPPMLIIDSLKL